MGVSACQPDVPAHPSPEDYLRLERAADYKHEYVGGVVRAMAGANYAHNLLCNNVAFELTGRLRGKGCTPVGSDQRVHSKSKASFAYPDLSVVGGEPEFMADKKPGNLLNPTVLVEVLSGSTKDYDPGREIHALSPATKPAALPAARFGIGIRRALLAR